ncbi:MAG: NUDIX domain-containing protein [Mycoplasmatales bacterium]
MAITEKGYQVPDGYATDILLIGWNKKNKELEVLLIKRPEMESKNKFALPGGFVEYGETAPIAASRELFEETGIKLNFQERLVREIGMFDHPERDSRGWIISNALAVLVNFEEIEFQTTNEAIEIIIVGETTLKNLSFAFDHHEIINKAIKKLKYDIACQIFERQFFGDQLFTSLLGEDYTINNLYHLGVYAGRLENRSTFYRRINREN